MNPEKDRTEDQFEELSLDGSPSLDDFIRELEEKEKDLHISSDLVVQIEESDITDDETAELMKFLEEFQETKAPVAATATAPQKSVGTHYPQHNEKISKLESEIERLREQTSKLEFERIEMNESVRRRQQDFDNYRKRIDRERGETFRNLLSNMATGVLPVLDNLQRALDSASALPSEKSNDFQQFVDGVGLVNQQLNEVLGEMGIQPIISVGEPFDPNLHEAVTAEQTDDVPPHTVVAELLRGYRIGDKIIRHSLVKVSTPKVSG